MPISSLAFIGQDTFLEIDKSAALDSYRILNLNQGVAMCERKE